jgi:hypothetical protein
MSRSQRWLLLVVLWNAVVARCSICCKIKTLCLTSRISYNTHDTQQLLYQTALSDCLQNGDVLCFIWDVNRILCVIYSGWCSRSKLLYRFLQFFLCSFPCHSISAFWDLVVDEVSASVGNVRTVIATCSSYFFTIIYFACYELWFKHLWGTVLFISYKLDYFYFFSRTDGFVFIAYLRHFLGLMGITVAIAGVMVINTNISK